jgi:nucleoid DNA-binding protein
VKWSPARSTEDHGRGERVTIRGFGTFKVVQRNERMARNPKTGEPVKVAARKRLTFNSTK